MTAAVAKKVNTTDELQTSEEMLRKMPIVYLGDSPPWEQLVGEVRGLVLLGVWRCGVRPMVLLGEPWKAHRQQSSPKLVHFKKFTAVTAAPDI